ncbi:MAG TPA: DUF1552 domain-containing protein [Polyangiaceae bacterium]|nr:DUF1552 domain-containing protein [Polyangiaceae bacterium]
MFLGYRHSRRSFLLSATAAGLSVPLLHRIEAHAQGAPEPRRLLIIQRAVGSVRAQWLPSGNPSQTAAGNLALNRGTGTRAAVAVGGVSAAFEPLRAKTTIIDGLNIVASGSGDRTHEGGMVALMTGQPTTRKVGQEDHKAGGASIDQLLLDRSPWLQGTRVPSLALGTDARSDRGEVSPRVLSYRPPPLGAVAEPGARGPDAVPIFPTIEPVVAYSQLFGSVIGGAPSQNAADVARLRAERRSVVDYLKSDLSRLESLVPVAERPLIEAHVDAIRSLETSFDSALDIAGSGCLPPGAEPRSYGLAQTPANQSGQNAFHGEIGLLQLAIIRAAFACDLTRTATFMWSPGTNLVVFGGLYDGMRQEEHHLTSHDQSESKEHDLVAIERWYADRTVEALQEFDRITTPDGSTLLDNTVVPYLTEVARGYDHDQSNAPFAVVGGSKLGIPGDRFYRADGPNRPTNDLWLALAPAFDVDLPRLGAQEQSSGALPNFRV